MFKFHAEATTVEKLKEQIEYFLKTGFTNVAAPQAPQAPSAATNAEQSAAAAPVTTEPAKKPGRPKKAEAPGVGTTAPSPAAPAPAAAAAAGTIDPVRAACMKVNEKFGDQGLSLVAEILKKHGGGVARIAEVKPEHQAAVIAACEKAVA